LGLAAQQDPIVMDPITQPDSAAFGRKLEPGFPVGLNSVMSGCPLRPNNF